MRHLFEITYFTNRLEEMVEFYRKLLDVEPADLSAESATFLTGTVKLFLHTAYTPSEGELPPCDHLAVAARNLDAACQEIAGSGISIETHPKDYYWGRSAYLRDPDGHQVELQQASVDWSNAHRFFAGYCFNAAWDLIDKKERTPEEFEQMIELALASIYHWKQRPDCTEQNLSVGYWQAARAYALSGQADNARRYGQLSLEHSQGTPPFYTGFAYEALARAEMVARNPAKTQEYLHLANQFAGQISDPEEKQILEADLKTIQ